MGKKRVSHSSRSKNNRKISVNAQHRLHLGSVFKLYGQIGISFKILIAYMLLIASSYLLFAFYPSSLFLGRLLPNNLAAALNFIIFITLTAAAYGIIMKKYWGWQLAFGWFVFEIFNSVISLRFLENGFFTSYITAGSYFTIALNISILWLLYKKKHNFITPKKAALYQREDRAFVFSFSILFMLMILLAASFFAKLYVQTATLSKQIIEEISDKNYDQALFVCEDKTGMERDMCYVVAAVAFEGFDKELCNLVEFDFYRATCMRAAK